MCQWFVTEFLDINTEILAQMTGLKAVSSNHVFNHFLTLLQMVGLFVQLRLRLHILVVSAQSQLQSSSVLPTVR